MTFDDVSNAFIMASFLASPSELHGMLCGRLCGGQRPTEKELHQMTAKLLDTELDRVAELGDVLRGLYQYSLEQLEHSGFEFQPLLPDDDDALIEDRTKALGEWCQGYLYGLGQSGLSGETQLTADIAGVLRDLASISQADGDSVENDGDEVSYVELVEYVRVAVLLVYAELNVPNPHQPPVVH